MIVNVRVTAMGSNTARGLVHDLTAATARGPLPTPHGGCAHPLEEGRQGTRRSEGAGTMSGMKRIIAGVAATFLLVACGTDTTPPEPTTHGKDEIDYLDPAERDATLALAAKCTEDAPKVHAEARTVLSDMTDKGVRDETMTTLLRHVADSIPDSAPRMECAQVFTVYARMREG